MRLTVQMFKTPFVVVLLLSIFSFTPLKLNKPLQKPPETLSVNILTDNLYILQNGSKKEVYLYLELNALKAEKNKDKTPLNISLVLDRSGSMASENKLDYAKKACDFVIDNLTSSDNFSLVVYDSEVKTLSASETVKNKQLLKNKVATINPGSTTNLSGGMLQGFNEVKSTFAPKAVNRVLLLSDGLANNGITDPIELQKIVQTKNSEDGISISTFGVGADFNEDMMTNLAEYGSGNYYFIDNADKIPEIFANELKGLLSVVAQNTQVEIKYPSAYFRLAKLYGYPYTEEKEGSIKVNFKDVFSEETKAVLLKFEMVQTPDTDVAFQSNITYDDALGNYSRETLNHRLDVKITDDKELHDNSFNEKVKKNIILFEANEEMEKALLMVDKRLYNDAKSTLDSSIVRMEKVISEVQSDSSLNLQYENLKSYRDKIDNIKQMNEEERKMMQKANKSSNYMLKKKKQN
ncbi:vWA domain-containing protein [Chondrinema litorale]|uniref:vWA domain-containing protein n=1 Tax=Chondrinema litorale TaxID=2994555 RepID=UPI0025429EB9|nr:VWA domain-containing protein [Chondrinema litorale]UZR93375.1 VWA domain-containing protein [Chondrinema litorale]